MSEVETKTDMDPDQSAAIGNARFFAFKAIEGLLRERIEFAGFEQGGHRFDLACVESETSLEFTFKVKKL